MRRTSAKRSGLSAGENCALTVTMAERSPFTHGGFHLRRLNLAAQAGASSPLNWQCELSYPRGRGGRGGPSSPPRAGCCGDSAAASRVPLFHSCVFRCHDRCGASCHARQDRQVVGVVFATSILSLTSALAATLTPTPTPPPPGFCGHECGVGHYCTGVCPAQFLHEASDCVDHGEPNHCSCLAECPTPRSTPTGTVRPCACDCPDLQEPSQPYCFLGFDMDQCACCTDAGCVSGVWTTEPTPTPTVTGTPTESFPTCCQSADTCRDRLGEGLFCNFGFETSYGAPYACNQTTGKCEIALPMATATPSSCVGDCNADGVVHIDEIITGVNIALGGAPGSRCPAFDCPQPLPGIFVNCAVIAVNNALNGCSVAPTPPPPAPELSLIVQAIPHPVERQVEIAADLSHLGGSSVSYWAGCSALCRPAFYRAISFEVIGPDGTQVIIDYPCDGPFFCAQYLEELSPGSSRTQTMTVTGTAWAEGESNFVCYGCTATPFADGHYVVVASFVYRIGAHSSDPVAPALTATAEFDWPPTAGR
jgi:hypothetical protein